MKLLKVSLVSLLVFCSPFLVSQVFAAETVTKKTIVVANVNVYETKIVSQNGNNINISFDIENGAGAQSGLKYGVNLIKKTTKGQFLADEFVFPESLILSANSTVKKNINYIAPDGISGEYTILVMVKNDSGMPLGLGLAGSVKLTSTQKTVEIMPDTCTLSVTGEKGSPKYTLMQGVDISSKENLILNCTAVNNSSAKVTSTPTYETHYRTLYGDVVSQEGGSFTPITFNAGEKKSISLSLPKALKAQSYDVKMSLMQEGVFSNTITTHYVLHGASATIQNLSLDKDYYANKDVAKISFSWSPSADNFPGSRLGSSGLSNIVFSSTITDDKHNVCISPLNEVLNKVGLIEVSAPVIANCNNPQVSIQLKDQTGTILDQKDLSFLSKTETSKSNMGKIILVVVGILVVAGLAFYFINLKRKENETVNQ